MSKPFKDHAYDLLAKGYSPFPLKKGKKFPPPVGYTGYSGKFVDAADIDQWLERHKWQTGNIGVRLPQDVIGIDVDMYDGKQGRETIEEAQRRLGPLPVSPVITSREDGSGIRLFRVPAGRCWADEVGPGVEVLHWGHRYAVAPPSIHPDTGKPYTGQLLPVGDLPEFPPTWVEDLDRGDAAERPGKADLREGEIFEFLQKLPDGDPCQCVDRVLLEAEQALSAREGSRHGIGLREVGRLIRVGDQGHRGVRAALDTLESLWLDAMGSDRPTEVGNEWARMVTGAVALAAGNPTLKKDKGCCGGVSAGAVDVTNDAVARDWLRSEIGQGPMSGVFRRGWGLVYTPRIGEEGYEPLTESDRDEDGPAQVRPMRAQTLAAWVGAKYQVERSVGKEGSRPALFPISAALEVAALPEMAPNLQYLRRVTHTPMMRKDGSVLWEPGYDPETRSLFLPEPGLVVPQVPDEPTAAEVGRARGLLLEMIAGFRWLTINDRANYLCAALTPLMREITPPPYQMLAINAPVRGSGKSLLAETQRIMHGGVLRGDIPNNDEEIRKQFASLLMTTTAPVVQFDNVRRLDSTQLDGLLTSATWSDRVLGKMEDSPTLHNDRLWIATGNNISLGGDLVRRVLWTTIDPDVANPERRRDFAITNLPQWVRQRRGELLWSLLVLIRHWHVEGRPTPEPDRSDSFGEWLAVANGILASADIEGTAGHRDTQQQDESDEDEEWGAFLAAVYEEFGPQPWGSKDLLVAGSDFGDPSLTGIREAWPAKMKESAVSIGYYLANRNRRKTSNGYRMDQRGKQAGGKGAKLWVVTRDGDDLI